MSAETPDPNNIRIVIDFNPNTSQILVTGPTDNLPLFLGMMETAKFVVLQERVKAKESPLVLPVPPKFELIQH